MSKARRQHRERRNRDHAAGAGAAQRVRPLLLPAVVALLVATHLIPSEAVAREGTHAVLCMAWCALFVVWGIVTAFLPQPRVTFSWSDAALVVLIGLVAISGLIPRDGIVTRNTWNVVWVWVSYGIAAVLLRQLLTSPVQVRAVLAVMVALAICLTAHAYYQYFVSMPLVRAEFHANPEQVLREERIPLDPDSPTRQHFIDRVEAREPLATFALTNSLAGFLATWIVVVAGLALVSWQTRQHRSLQLTAQVAAAALVVAALLFGCLLLTKSRTGLLAAAAGGVLIALYGRSGGWRLDWRLPLAGGGMLVLLGLAAVAVGGLDAKVLSEAPKSMIYRLEYWRATAAMIGDYPLWGCGPGNFQDYYPRYKLPQASETIADPHNGFLEVWAMAGTPALVALLSWLGLLALDIGRRRDEASAAQPDVADDTPIESEVRRIHVGAVLGIVLGFGMAFLTVFPLWSTASSGHIGIGLIGLPLAGLFLWLVRPWVAGGQLPVWLPVVGLVTLLVNLSAAGAASFPGVVSSAWVLAAAALLAAQPYQAIWSIPRPYLPALIVAPLALGFACFWTEYSPVLRHQVLMHEAQQLVEESRRHPARLPLAIDRLYAAAQADSASSNPWEQLAALHFEQWLATEGDEAWERFVAAADEWQRLRPASHGQHAQRGAWFLQAWRKSGQPDHLRRSRLAYEQAVDRYPASALTHAQLAWLYHLSGDAERSQAETARAQQLDAQNPHEEFQLRRNRLVDPQPDESLTGGWRMQRPETAEQTLEALRKGVVASP